MKIEENEEAFFEDFKTNQLIQIPKDGSGFMANGVQYFIEDQISIDRWIKLQDLQIELGFGVEFEEMQQKWFSVIDMGNKQRFSDIVITAHNMVNGISKVYSRIPQILKFCALFINSKDEDRGIITDDMIEQKVNNWKAEGLGIDGFLEFSLLKVKGLAEGFRNAILDASSQQ